MADFWHPTGCSPAEGATNPSPQAGAGLTRQAPAGAALPKPDHIVIVVFENKDVDQVLGSGDGRS
jgi:hypothetical protein